MKALNKRSGEDNMFVLLIGILIAGLLFLYKSGISGNDFWWHVKAGEWMVNNRAIPNNIDIFSWFAKENGIKWIPQEWLSEVFFFIIHDFFGNVGIFILSLFSAIGMAMLIVVRNKRAIKKNVLMSIGYLFPIIFLFPQFFYGRPSLISFFLLYATLFCLYRYSEDETSKLIYLVPFISILWTNFHGGSSTLSYLLCFIFMLSGLFEFSIGKIKSKKLSKRQLFTYLIIGLLSILAFLINPNGLKILLYPYTNMGDSYMQMYIKEWAAPDAKQFYQLLIFFIPMLMIGINLIITEKKIKFLDLLIFLFFSYLSFRSVRFSILFYIASTFFAFDYFLPKKINPMKTKLDLAMFYILIISFLGVNILSISTMVNTFHNGKLISVALDTKFIELVKKESPKRIFSDYNFGETLIYNNIDTFVDAREDLFAQYNLRDAISLSILKQVDENKKTGVFDPEKLINKYGFDAFLIQSNLPLAAYLRSKPEKYVLILENNDAVYFKVIDPLSRYIP